MAGHLWECYCVVFVLLSFICRIQASSRFVSVTSFSASLNDVLIHTPIDLIDSDLHDNSANNANMPKASINDGGSTIKNILSYRVATVISKSCRPNTIAGLSARILSSTANDEDLVTAQESVEEHRSWKEQESDTKAALHRFILGHIVIAGAAIICVICTIIYIYEVFYCCE